MAVWGDRRVISLARHGAENSSGRTTPGYRNVYARRKVLFPHFHMLIVPTVNIVVFGEDVTM